MKTLITGGLGFIGLALARRLLAEGHGVTLVDSLTPQIHGALPLVTPPEGARVERLDVRELPDHADLLEGVDAVYHLAAETGTAQSMYRMQGYVSVNDLGTAALLEAVAKCTRRPTQLVLASSRSVYGEGAYVSASAPTVLVQPGSRPKAQLDAAQWEPLDAQGRVLMPVPTPETLPFAPGSVYAATKAAQELLVQSASHALGFCAKVFRFQNVYGEGQSLQNPYTGIISIFYNRARQGLEIPVYEDGLESRDFVHVADIVDGLVAALRADMPSGAPVNLGAGVGTSVQSLANTLIGVSGHHVGTRVTGQYRVGDIRHCFASLDRARSWLGFEPKVTLEDGLRRFCAWAETQAAHEDRLAQATEELRQKGLAN